MSQTTIRSLTAVAALAFAGIVACSAHRAQAGGDHCFYKGTMFSDGAAACQAGTLHRCDDGDWRSTGAACSEGRMAMSRNCEFGGITYSTGAASCQAGTQFRCEDGSWRSIGMACPVGDAPIRVLPSGRTCMYGDVTVSTNSTVCKSGSTFLCSDGDWVNLGTLCR